MEETNSSQPFRLLLDSLLRTRITFERTFTETRRNVIKHLPHKDVLINNIWDNPEVLTNIWLSFKNNVIKKRNLACTECLPKNNWATLLEILSKYEFTVPNTLINRIHIQIFLKELTVKTNEFKPFWNPSYDELSKNLLLPKIIDPNIIVICKKGTNKRFLTANKIKVQDEETDKTYFKLSQSTVVDKWQNEVVGENMLKTLKIRLKVNTEQRKTFNEWFNTSNYVYNRTVSCINDGEDIHFNDLRDKLVTENTKKNNTEYVTLANNIKLYREEKRKQQNLLKKIPKTETTAINLLIQTAEEKYQKEKEKLNTIKKSLKSSKNENIRKWETNTPKEIRAGAVNDVCKAYKTAFANLKLGHIKHFRLGFRKKNESNKCLLLPKSSIANNGGILTIAKTFLKSSKISMGKKTIKKHKNLVIEHDCRLVKQKNEYWLFVPVPVVNAEKKEPLNYCGIDPGVKTFMTCFGNNGCIEYKYKEGVLHKLDNKINYLTDRRRTNRGRVHKKKINKLEKRKESLVDELHWKTINNLLKMNDFIFYGDIKSHDIVKNGKNRTLNTDINNLKFFKFKQRLLFKSIEKGKKVFEVKEQYTTQTCSFCGSMYKPGLSRVYKCKNCEKYIGRDVNAAKNILMKGIQTCLY
jgi:putative transposase